MKFFKCRDVKTPTRANPTDAGIDFYIPNSINTEELLEKNPTLNYENFKVKGEIKLFPNERILIPSGIHTFFNDGYALVLMNKSGVASKKGLVVGSCISPDTIILTNRGKFRAKDLTKKFIKKNKVKVLSFNEKTNETEYKDFDGFRISNIDECIKFTLDDGNELICNHSHMFLIKNKWIQASSLNIGDFIS